MMKLNLGTVGLTDREILDELKAKFDGSSALVKNQIGPVVSPMLDLLDRIISRLEAHNAEFIDLDGGLHG